MLTVCWSVKGGSGTSTVTAGLAALESQRLAHQPHNSSVVVIDLAGDLPAIFGVAYPTHGLSEWLSRSIDSDFSDLSFDCGYSIRLVSSGSFPLPDASSPLWGRLASVIEAEIAQGKQVYIDVGCRNIPEALLQRPGRPLTRVLLVLRPCYLALRRAVNEKSLNDDVLSDGIVLVTGGGRVLTRRDVETVLGIPVVAEIPLDPDIARRVDSGLFHSHLPRTLITSLTSLLPAPSS